MIRVLVVDSKVRALELVKGLSKDGCQVILSQTGREVFNVLMKEKIDVAIVSDKLPGGLDMLARLRTLYPALDVIMLINHGAVDTVVKSMKLGAHDCMVRPVDISDLSVSVHRAYGKRKAVNEAYQFVGESPAIRGVKKHISLVASSMVPILILGETGTGKEVVARAIHIESDRSSQPFVAVNASALPENILESELFGHKKGAFTSADSDKAGLLDIANKGTFFADEVGDLALSIQARLLRVIETGTFRKLGDTKERKVSVRLVCATNKDLEQEVEKKTFRADLYYRLSTFIIRVPPLRERKEDLPLLIDHFFGKICKGDPPGISPEALKLLMEYPWPGNVRELAHTLERAFILSAGDREIGTDALPLNIVNSRFVKTRTRRNGTPPTRLEDAKREYIAQILESTDGNKSRAARILGISRTKLYNRLLER